MSDGVASQIGLVRSGAYQTQLSTPIRCFSGKARIDRKVLGSKIGKAGKRLIPTKKKGEESNSSPFRRRPGRTLSDRGAGSSCTRTRGVHADHAGLIGEVHILAGRGRGDRRSRYRVRLVARARGEHKGVTALGTGRQHGVNQIRRRGAGRTARRHGTKIAKRGRKLAV